MRQAWQRESRDRGNFGASAVFYRGVSVERDLLIGGVARLEQVRSHNTSSVRNGNHTTRTDGCTGRSDDRRGPVSDEWNDSCVGTGDHKNPDVSSSDTGHSREEDITDSDKDQGADDVLRGPSVFRCEPQTTQSPCRDMRWNDLPWAVPFSCPSAMRFQ